MLSQYRNRLTFDVTGQSGSALPGALSSVSGLKQQNSGGRMTLELVKYLYRRTLKCGVTQLQRQIPGLLFLDATLCDQRTDTHRSCFGCLRVKILRVYCQSHRSEIERS